MPIITLISSSSEENWDYVDPSFQLSYFLFNAGKLIAQSLNWVLFRVLKQGWLIQNSLFYMQVLFFSLYSALLVQRQSWLLSPSCYGAGVTSSPHSHLLPPHAQSETPRATCTTQEPPESRILLGDTLEVGQRRVSPHFI